MEDAREALFRQSSGGNSDPNLRGIDRIPLNPFKRP